MFIKFADMQRLAFSWRMLASLTVWPPMQTAKSTPQKSLTPTIVRDAYDQRIEIEAQ
jgi:hypothetical protein